MTHVEMDCLFDEYEQAQIDSHFGSNEPAGFWMTYKNPQGETHEFLLRNPIYSRQYPNCIEGDCFSVYQYDKTRERYGIEDPDSAITSHRTFNISRNLKAFIEYE